MKEAVPEHRFLRQKLGACGHQLFWPPSGWDRRPRIIGNRQDAEKNIWGEKAPGRGAEVRNQHWIVIALKEVEFSCSQKSTRLMGQALLSLSSD